MSHLHRIALERTGAVLADARRQDDRTLVDLQLEGIREPCVLHWGAGRGADRWQVPAPAEWPADSHAAADAVETRFPGAEEPVRLTINLPAASGYTSLDFVLFFPASGRWDNNRGRDYRVPLPDGDRAAAPASAGIEAMAREIVERETGRHSWTLMHRFNLCHDLLERVPAGDERGLSLIFVWLRYSAIRQLDWQRDYNTKPRELAHAQDRLTRKLAARFLAEAGDRPWLRLIMTTLGRGGEGQRVRDEVLNIMHRHHIKEVSGHFMEEWHQKLHNNTTPDDVVICEAFLAFLKSDGSREVFYRTLEAGGVTRARLHGYDRPIRSDPDFIPELKDALIHDFEAFLRILQALHSGTDLVAALDAARPLLDGALAGDLDWIRRHRDDPAVPVDALAARLTGARRALAGRLDAAAAPEVVRALVYLDFALEDLLRLSIERQLHQPPGADQLTALVGLALDNTQLSAPDAELGCCRRQWERVGASRRDDPAWPLRADAALERIGRAVAVSLDRLQALLQPQAERLGRDLGADDWTITAFSEEVLRGRPASMLPVLARLLRRLLRRESRLPPWQLLSQGPGGGELRVVASLASIQGTRFPHPTIVLASTVGGQEEIPGGVTAIVTPQDADLLSHLAIRARNAGVLFATCHDPDEIDRLATLAGRHLQLGVGPGGSVVVREGPARPAASGRRRPARLAATAGFSSYALTRDRFDEATVGRKAWNLARLEGRLPPWIELPRSVAVPFGVFDRVLADPRNAEAAGRYRDLLGRLDGTAASDAAGRRRVLEDLRGTIAGLAEPDGLLASLRASVEASGLPPADPGRAWSCIRQVWASKWNERAVLSREANGVDHEALAMAVLVQRVVEAEYAFVIHTASPVTGAADELYAEIVPGLGETLVGAYPGRALGFAWNKAASRADLLAFPSKSAGLFGGGLIFRSDSNAEDLAGYAGAGLYDSVMLAPPREVLLDYAAEPLVWDAAFRQHLLATVAEIGLAVERALGGAQDVEGAYAKGQWHVLQARPQVGAGGA